MLSLDVVLEANPEVPLCRTRNFRIDKRLPIEFATEKPERAEKLKEHIRRIRRGKE